MIAEEAPKTLYKQDCVEIYITPEERLYWGHPLHFQFGFSPSGKNGVPEKYAWFQDKDFPEIQLKVEKKKSEYTLYITIPFQILNINPQADKVLNFSIAVHDYDRQDNTDNCKFNLHFVPIYERGSQKGFELAKLKLIK